MQNISAFGLVAHFLASVTFPNGVSITEFGDDADPLDTPELDLADSAMGTNGDMIVWSRPQGIEITIAVIATSADDINLAQVFEANRVGKGKTSARDIITGTINYPMGGVAQLSNGIMVTGTALPPVQSSGRLKTRTYRFRFENITKSGFTGN
jgi:hypothetical protein